MVVSTRAQGAAAQSSRLPEATVSRIGRSPCRGEPSVPIPEPPAPRPPPRSQPDPITTLAQQVEALTAAVVALQQHQQPAATEHRPSGAHVLSTMGPQLSLPGEGRRSSHRHASHRPRSHSSHGGSHRSSVRRVFRRRSISRSLTPALRPGGSSHRRYHPREGPRKGKRSRSASWSLSGRSEEGSTDEASRRSAARRLDRHERELRHVTQQLANLQKGGRDSGEWTSRPPLSRRILEEPVPSRFKMPQLEPYDGTTDPLDHLESYKALMRIQGAPDSLLCVAFPATLRKAARAWYSRLEPRSIDSFRQLEKKFVAYFSACRKMPREADSLFAVRQQDGESLKDFVSRFKAATLEVYQLDDGIAMLALKRGLRPSRFTYSLDKNPPKSYSEVLARAQKYIRADEAAVVRREAEGRPSKKKSKGMSEEAHPSRPGAPRRQDSGSKNFANRAERFTPLLAPRSQILMEIEGESFLRRPDPMKPSFTRDKRKYCRFHRDHGHDTDNCRHLKREIEDLIKRGYLGKYVGKSDARPAAQIPTPLLTQADIDNRPTGEEVGMISWGSERSPKRPRDEGKLMNVISFSDQDLVGVCNPHNDAIVVSMTIAKHDVKRILVDSGSSADVLSYDAFVRMNVRHELLRPVKAPLVGFTGDSVGVEGEIALPVTAGSYPRQSTVLVTFTVVRIASPYNAILGRPGLNLLDAVISTKRLLVRFPTRNGVGEMRGDQCLARRCFLAAPKQLASPISPSADQLDVRSPEKRGEPAEQLLDLPLDGDPSKTVRIGASLSGPERDQLLSFLQRNSDVFAWSAADMPGVPSEVITHQLKVSPSFKPIRQKKRSFAPDRQKAINEEIEKLLSAGFIREVHYPEWLANVVMVRKASGNWRICIDFTDLNKACPKDSFPLPKIDQLVDATAGHKRLSFMDAFSGYNQIRMAPEDEEHTAFVTDRGTYCYKVMPFGLKNAGATYQRLVNKVFKDQLGRNMEVYVDDMLVKSVEEADHVQDLEEAFSALRRNRMRLNPTKCAFGLGAGKFLGFMVTQRGIEANPEKIQAILGMRSPVSKKEVQQLTGRVAALSRFISRSAERCLPFFKALRRSNHFSWTEECERSFNDLKKFLADPTLLSKPEQGEKLYLYLAASSEAVSSVLVRLDERSTQKPIYYTSRVLHDAETRYSRTEKIVFALIISAQRLRPYFQAHPIEVVTDQPLKAILHRPDTSGRTAKWAIKLSEFDITYSPRSSIKAQALADFLVECTWSDNDQDALSGDGPEDPIALGASWILHVDGASNSCGSGAGLILADKEGTVTEYALRFSFKATNNQAEYEALLAGLNLANQLKVRNLRVFTDSQLVAGQVNGEYEARDPIMVKYLSKVRELSSTFSTFDIFHVPRRENARADALSRLATSSDALPGRAYVEYLEKPSIDEPEEVLQVHPESSWIDRFVEYLTTGIVPDNPPEGKRFKWKASQFLLVDGQLYKRSFSLPLLRCLRPSEANFVLQEIHEGVCGNHLGARALAYKALRQGYYWPTMKEDAADLVRRCDSCQRHDNIQRQPAHELSQLTSPWPFAQWGMDILGPFPPASGQRKFLVVAVDYFTKWVEAEPLARITEANVKNFFWRSIVCRFGVPHTLVTDNGKQFDNRAFREFCAELGIRHRFTSVGHPQSNGEAEVTNRTILRGLRTRLDESKGRWADELPAVLWAYRTTSRVPTGETPFCLAFGSEAVIPVELGHLTFRTKYYDEASNGDQLRTNLDLIEEVRDSAKLRMATYRQRVARYYNSKVKPKAFRCGDLVLRRSEVSKPLEQGKLSPNWEGPYRIAEAFQRGAYRLEDLEGNLIPRMWNAENLRVYYQ